MSVFKRCSMRGMTWIELGEFVKDVSLFLNGYQAAFDNPQNGLLLSTHQQSRCGTTLALKAVYLKPLVNIQETTRHNTGDDSCPRCCLQKKNLEPLRTGMRHEVGSGCYSVTEERCRCLSDH